MGMVLTNAFLATQGQYDNILIIFVMSITFIGSWYGSYGYAKRNQTDSKSADSSDVPPEVKNHLEKIAAERDISFREVLSQAAGAIHAVHQADGQDKYVGIADSPEHLDVVFEVDPPTSEDKS
jgi:hypothetical protein